MTGYLYLVTCLVNGKLYVGCTRAVDKRWKQHLGDARRGQGHLLHRAIRRHGAAAFRVDVLAVVVGTLNELFEAEKRAIATHSARHPSGYNLTSGGEGVDFTVPRVRAVHRAATRRAMETPEWKEAHRRGVEARADNPEWQRNRAAATQVLLADPKFRARLTEAARCTSKNPIWREHVATANRLSATDPAWRAAHRAGVQRQEADPAFRQARLDGVRRHAATPAGQRQRAESVVEARAARDANMRARDALRTPEELAAVQKRRDAVRRSAAKRRAAP